MTYKVVYDFDEEWLRLYPFIFLGAFLFCSMYLWTRIKRERRKNLSYSHIVKNLIKNYFGALAFAILFFVFGYTLLDIPDYMHAKKLYRTGHYKQTFGYITHFSESNHPKCNTIEFMLNGLKFTFADCYAVYGCGYKPVSLSHIGDSSLVRLYYADDDESNAVLRNRVLRLEFFK